MVRIKNKEYRNVYLDVETKQLLEELSKQTGIPQNRLVRKALELYKKVIMNEIGNQGG